jgi:hypothetical protein
MKNQPFTFTGDLHSGTLSGGLLVVNGGNIDIKGHTIEGLTGGEIHTIETKVIDGIVYKYQIVLNGKADWIGGNWEFYFTDEEPDTYTLGVHSPITENHYVDYNSKAPNLVKIHWTKSS